MVLAIPFSSSNYSPERGLTQSGEEILVYAWRELEPLSARSGRSIRAYCPLHGSDRQRSLSINGDNGWGQCFGCQRRVLVRDWNPHLAASLVRHAQRVARVPSAAEKVGPPPRHRLPVSHPVEMKGPVQPWQEEERALLTSIQAKGALRVDRAEAWNAQAYLAARHIPLDLALATGVGYLEPGASERYQQKLLVRWEDRLLFSLQASPSSDNSAGYAGRLLWHWQRCQDEIVHKQYLEAQEKKRWIKTNPAGWFWDPQHLPADEPLVVVEGPFDRLAALAAGGFQPGDVMALVGTALQPIWLQGKIRAILLALDADQAGRDASQRIAQQLAFHHVVVEPCLLPAHGGGGKDWSERWRRRGAAGIEALYAEHALLAQRL